MGNTDLTTVIVVGALVGLLFAALGYGQMVWLVRQAKVRGLAKQPPTLALSVGIWAALALGAAGLIHSLATRHLPEQEALLAGEDLFSVRPRPGLVATYVASGPDVKKGEVLMRFTGQDGQEAQLAVRSRRQVLVSELELEKTRPLELDPDLARRVDLASAKVKDLESREMQLASERDAIVREAEQQRLAIDNRRFRNQQDDRTAARDEGVLDQTATTKTKLLSSDENLLEQGVGSKAEVAQERDSVAALQGNKSELADRRAIFARERKEIDDLSTRAEKAFKSQLAARASETSDVETRLTDARGLLATAQSALDGDRPRAEDQRNQRLHQIQLEIDDCDALQGMQAAAEAPWDGRIGFREPSPSSPPADNGPLLVMYHPGNLVVTIRLDDDQAAPANEDLAVEMAAITAPHDLDGMDRPETFFPGTLVGRSAAANGFVELRATVAPPERLVRQVAMGGTVPVKARLRRALTSIFSFRLAVGFGAIALLLSLARAWRRRRGRQAETDGETSGLPMVVPQTVGLTAYPARRRPITVELLEDAPGHAALPATPARPAINELPDAPRARLMPGPPLAALAGDEPVDLNDPIYLTGLGARFRYSIEAGELHPPLVYEVGGALRQGGYHAAALVVAGFGGTIAKQAVVRAAFDLLDHSAPDADIGEAARDCAEFLLVIRIIGSDRLNGTIDKLRSGLVWAALAMARRNGESVERAGVLLRPLTEA